MRDMDAWLAVFVAAVGIALVAFGMWLTFAAPCSWLGWMSVKDLPARCLGAMERAP